MLWEQKLKSQNIKQMIKPELYPEEIQEFAYSNY